MDNFVAVLNSVVPLILIMLVGVLTNKIGIVSEQGFKQINSLLFKVIFPCLVFNNIYKADLSAVFKSQSLIFILLFSTFTFILYYFWIKLIEQDSSRRAVMLQGVIRTSALIFGLPLASNILGEDNMAIVSLAAALTVPLNSFFPALSFALYSDYQISFKSKLAQLFKNPIFLAGIIAIIVKLINLQLPLILENTVSKISAAATPLALICIGGTFKVSKLAKFDKSLFFTVISKVLIIPLAAVSLGAVLGFRNQDLLAILIVSGGPTSVSSYPQAVAAGGDTELANNIIVYSTIAGILTILLFVVALSSLGLITQA